jgi:transposase
LTPIEIWFQDEARVGQKGTHAYIWARLAQGSVRRSRMEWQGEGAIGSRPLTVHDNRHDSAYIFGAICPARAVGAAVLMPAANAEAMNEHLKEISTPDLSRRTYRAGLRRCRLASAGQAIGRAGQYQSVVVAPYSPELNPMENVWDYLRQNKLCTQVWDTYDDILEACKTASNWLIADPDRIRSIGAKEWACVNVSADWY